MTRHLLELRQVCGRDRWLSADAAAEGDERVHEPDTDAQVVQDTLVLSLLLGGARYLVAKAPRDPRVRQGLFAVVTLDLGDSAHATDKVTGLIRDIGRIIPEFRLDRGDLQPQRGGRVSEVRARDVQRVIPN